MRGGVRTLHFGELYQSLFMQSLLCCIGLLLLLHLSQLSGVRCTHAFNGRFQVRDVGHDATLFIGQHSCTIDE